MCCGCSKNNWISTLSLATGRGSFIPGTENIALLVFLHWITGGRWHSPISRYERPHKGRPYALQWTDTFAKPKLLTRRHGTLEENRGLFLFSNQIQNWWKCVKIRTLKTPTKLLTKDCRQPPPSLFSPSAPQISTKWWSSKFESIVELLELLCRLTSAGAPNTFSPSTSFSISEPASFKLSTYQNLL